MNGTIKIKTLVSVIVFGIVGCFLVMEILGSSRDNEVTTNPKLNREAPVLVRGIPMWPFSKAMKKADFVVIATAYKTEVTKDKFSRRNNRGIIEDYLLGQDTKFLTALVLKGDKKTKEFTLLHFRMKPNTSVGNGPMLVKFQLKKKDDIGDEIDSSFDGVKYLLFLKKRKDGRYEPLEGFDPALVIQKLSSAE